MEKTAMKRVARAEVKSHEKKMHGVKKMRAGGKTNLVVGDDVQRAAAAVAGQTTQI